jgi:ATP-dependent protease ClpP protease subunit
MNLKYNSGKIYNNWIKDSIDVFSKWSDSDFFSDKGHHIYFYSGVDDESVSKLQNLLKDSSKTKIIDNISFPPKPIIIHLNSPGGSVLSMNLFNTIITTQRVPLCVIIEGLCASAATTLALLAPYRIIIDYSSYLIHDMAGFSFGKEHEKISEDFQFIYQWRSNYISLLKDRTSLSDEEIKKFISRDLLIDANYCLKNKIIDRILKFPKINNSSYYNKKKYSELSLNLDIFLKKTNLNHIYIDPDKIYDYESVSSNDSSPTLLNAYTLSELCISLDTYILNQKNNIIKPLLIHLKPSSGYLCNPLNIISLNYRLSLIQQKTPIIALIEGPQKLDNLGLILMCPIKIMMTPSIISSTFSSISSGSLKFGWKTIDVLYNTKYTIKNIIHFLKKFSKLPKRFYDELPNKIINLKPKDLLKYKIIDQVVNFRDITPLELKNLESYYELDTLTSNYNNIPKTKKINKKNKKRNNK